jgi:antitoxin (DNA-binding transcriptional repressor) of toxin-antitoxin stability system
MAAAPVKNWVDGRKSQGRYTFLREERTMVTVTIEEAQAKLPELIGNLSPGEELVILRNQQPVARLVGEPVPKRRPRRPGSAKDTILHMADDFDAPLEDFKEYMQ